MATIPPGRLNDVTNAADHITLVADNFEILSEELFKQTPTYQNGAPNTIVGPPTTGAHVEGELWRDSLGGLFRCTVAGTPGTWLQILPAAVSADPASGTIPVGYLVLDVATGAVKRHAGGYVWEVKVGAAQTQKLGFWGVAPVVQPSGATQAALTLANQDNEIGGLVISNPPTQAEVQGLRDKCEELADDVRALSVLLHGLRSALVTSGIIKGSM